MSIAEKLTMISKNMSDVYEAGKTAEYNEFWDRFQQNGNVREYVRSFSGSGWNVHNWKPKYPINLSGTYRSGTGLFEYFDCTLANEPAAIYSGDIDFTNAGTLKSAFANSNIITVEMNAIVNCDLTKCFWSADIEHSVLENLTLGIGENCILDNVFYSKRLKNLSFLEGSVIAKTFDIQFCTVLSAQSIVNVVNILSDTVSGKSITFSQAAVNSADWSTTDYASFAELAATKPNWTFSQV